MLLPPLVAVALPNISFSPRIFNISADAYAKKLFAVLDFNYVINPVTLHSEPPSFIN